MNAPTLNREKKIQLLALAWLLLLAILALAGPFGLLSWSEKANLLQHRRDQIAALEDERAVLSNRVELLNPDHVDQDFASELTRNNLNVAHPDEYIIDLEEHP